MKTTRAATSALATIVDHADASWDPAYLALTPAMAAQQLLAKNGLEASDIAIWEVNEAFAAVAWSTANLLGAIRERSICRAVP